MGPAAALVHADRSVGAAPSPHMLLHSASYQRHKQALLAKWHAGARLRLLLAH